MNIRILTVFLLLFIYLTTLFGHPFVDDLDLLPTNINNNNSSISNMRPPDQITPHIPLRHGFTPVGMREMNINALKNKFITQNDIEQQLTIPLYIGLANYRTAQRLNEKLGRWFLYHELIPFEDSISNPNNAQDLAAFIIEFKDWQIPYLEDIESIQMVYSPDGEDIFPYDDESSSSLNYTIEKTNDKWKIIIPIGHNNETGFFDPTIDPWPSWINGMEDAGFIFEIRVKFKVWPNGIDRNYNRGCLSAYFTTFNNSSYFVGFPIKDNEIDNSTSIGNNSPINPAYDSCLNAGWTSNTQPWTNLLGQQLQTTFAIVGALRYVQSGRVYTTPACERMTNNMVTIFNTAITQLNQTSSKWHNSFKIRHAEISCNHPLPAPPNATDGVPNMPDIKINRQYGAKLNFIIYHNNNNNNLENDENSNIPLNSTFVRDLWHAVSDISQGDLKLAKILYNEEWPYTYFDETHQDLWETALDCGGTLYLGCAKGQRCVVDEDCLSGHCFEEKCATLELGEVSSAFEMYNIKSKSLFGSPIFIWLTLVWPALLVVLW